MSRKNYLLTIVLALVAAFAGQLIYGGLVSPRTAEARGDDSRLQWEYCAVTKAQFAGSSRGGAYWISYFRSSGSIDVVTIETGPTGNAFARAAAKLGDEGWDMVGEGPLEIRPGQPGGTPTAIFFKRRKE
ncbi:MAG: hypothetical protein H7Z38_12415 [Rubrivivax sp.]|nr:hypothetical protein [Pyrinomonadaceae bacterium]